MSGFCAKSEAVKRCDVEGWEGFTWKSFNTWNLFANDFGFLLWNLILCSIGWLGKFIPWGVVQIRKLGVPQVTQASERQSPSFLISSFSSSRAGGNSCIFLIEFFIVIFPLLAFFYTMIIFCRTIILLSIPSFINLTDTS